LGETDAFEYQHFVLEKFDWHCKAFPKRIPENIIFGTFDHTKPYEGDNGVLFIPIDNGLDDL
jgi:hypothetical protein